MVDGVYHRQTRRPGEEGAEEEDSCKSKGFVGVSHILGKPEYSAYSQG